VSTEWNATLYHQISAPQVSWGKKVLARIRLRGDEHVLDAGCGTGRLTRDLLEALPSGQVTGIDLSENMLRAAEEHLKPEFGERVRFRSVDLQHLVEDPNSPTAEYDVIFSTASFHWIKDHDRLFAGLYRVLRPGGTLLAQCGGAGNLDGFLVDVDALLKTEPYARFFLGFESPWEFATAEIAAQRLQGAGFVDIETNLESALTRFSSAHEYLQFVESVVLRRHLERLPDVVLPPAISHPTRHSRRRPESAISLGLYPVESAGPQAEPDQTVETHLPSAARKVSRSPASSRFPASLARPGVHFTGGLRSRRTSHRQAPGLIGSLLPKT
jgi:trans-aconitate 2-methyltransferase